MIAGITQKSMNGCHFDGCEQTFTRINRLRSHIAYFHLKKEKPHKCEICHKSFIEKVSLRSHLRTHTGEKHKQCKYCPRMFNTSGNLQDHERRHTQIKQIIKFHIIFRPYKCDICSNSYYRRYQLTNHLQQKHQSKESINSTNTKLKRAYNQTQSKNILPSHLFQDGLDHIESYRIQKDGECSTKISTLMTDDSTKVLNNHLSEDQIENKRQNQYQFSEQYPQPFDLVNEPSFSVIGNWDYNQQRDLDQTQINNQEINLDYISYPNIKTQDYTSRNSPQQEQNNFERYISFNDFFQELQETKIYRD